MVIYGKVNFLRNLAVPAGLYPCLVAREKCSCLRAASPPPPFVHLGKELFGIRAKTGSTDGRGFPSPPTIFLFFPFSYFRGRRRPNPSSFPADSFYPFPPFSKKKITRISLVFPRVSRPFRRENSRRIESAAAGFPCIFLSDLFIFPRCPNERRKEKS